MTAGTSSDQAIFERLQQAVAHHRAGRLDLAEGVHHRPGDVGGPGLAAQFEGGQRAAREGPVDRRLDQAGGPRAGRGVMPLGQPGQHHRPG